MSKTILVVEDELITRDILTTWLEGAGYDTLIAANGLEGLLEVRKNSPDLVVADIMMPQMDGLELCHMMRQLSGTPVMFLTGFGSENYKRKGFRAGGNDYLVKPVEMDDFLARVSDLLTHTYSPFPPKIDTIQARTRESSGQI